MRKVFFLSCFFLAILILSSSQVLAQISYPEPRGYVNDFANIISDDVEQKMELRLRDYETKTTNEIAVVTVASLEGLSIENYTIGLAEKWGVGKKAKDNGVVLLVAPNERKVRIEVGYGLEPVLTDSRSQQIIDAMTPYFKESKYSQGIELGAQKITDVLGYLSPEEKAAQLKEQAARDQETKATFLRVLMWLGIAIVLAVVFIFLWKKISAWDNERKRRQAVREKVSGKIPEVKKLGEDTFRELFFTAAKMERKYYPHQKMIEATVAKGRELSQEYQDFLGEAEKLSGKDPDAALEKVVGAEGFIARIQRLKDGLVDFDQKPKTIADGVADLKKRIENTSVAKKAIAELHDLGKVAPLEVWAALGVDLEKAETMQKQAAVLLKEIEEKHLASQNFNAAEANLKSARSLMETVEKYLEAPGKTLREFLAAQAKIPNLKKEFENKIRDAENKSKEDDAGENSKSLLTNARAKKLKADQLEASGAVNWLLVSSLLVAAIALIEKSRSDADENISAAYRRRRDDDYHRSSSWSSSSLSHSSSSSFGGFSGGGFGGGGASGGW